MYDFEDLAADELGFLEVVTPGQIADYRRSLLSSAASLNRDFARSNVDVNILESWQSWYNNFNQAARDATYVGDMWAGAMNALERSAKELQEWRQIYESQTGSAATGPSVSADTGYQISDQLLTGLKWGAGLIAGYFIWDLLRKR